MEIVEFIVDYKDLDQAKSSGISKCMEWMQDLGDLSTSFNVIKDSPYFEGVTADALKNYVAEVHIGTLITTLSTAAYGLCEELARYWGKYVDGIDSGVEVYISEAELQTIQKRLGDICRDMDGIFNNLTTNLEPISDLLNTKVPSLDCFYASLGVAEKKCSDLIDRIGEMELKEQANPVFADIDRAMSSALEVINAQSGSKRVEMRDYRPGLVTTMMSDWSGFSLSMESLAEYYAKSEEDFKKALEVAEEYAQEQRDSRAWVKYVAAGITVLGEIAIIAIAVSTLGPGAALVIGGTIGGFTAAVNEFADHYYESGNWVEGMDWNQFGKSCFVGAVKGSSTVLMGKMGNIMKGSVIDPKGMGITGAAKGIFMAGTTGTAELIWDVGDAVISGKSMEEVTCVLKQDGQKMLKNAEVGMVSGYVGGYVSGVVQLQGTDSYLDKVGGKIIEGAFISGGKFVSGTVMDVMYAANDGRYQEIGSILSSNWNNAGTETVESSVSAVFGGLTYYTDDIDNDVAKNSLEGLIEAGGDYSGKLAAGATRQYMSGEEFDFRDINRNELNYGADSLGAGLKTFGTGLYEDRGTPEEKFERTMRRYDPDGDGKIEMVQVGNYSVTKRDYDTAVRVAGTTGYEDKTAQEILGLSKDTRIDQAKTYTADVGDLRKSTYSTDVDTKVIRAYMQPTKDELEQLRRYAVDQAWKNERELVSQGKGTRNWSVTQQEELIRTGKVKGFDGAHMKDASTYSEYAGDPNNIQFLTYEEHIYGAHGKDTRESTNGRYDPATGRIYTFKDGENPTIRAKNLTSTIDASQADFLDSLGSDYGYGRSKGYAASKERHGIGKKK